MASFKLHLIKPEYLKLSPVLADAQENCPEENRFPDGSFEITLTRRYKQAADGTLFIESEHLSKESALREQKVKQLVEAGEDEAAARQIANQTIHLPMPEGLTEHEVEYDHKVIALVFEWMEQASNDEALIAHNKRLQVPGSENILRTPKPYTPEQKMNDWEIAQMDEYIPEFKGITSKWYQVPVSDESIIFVTDLLKFADYLELPAMMDSIALTIGRMNEHSTINVLGEQPAPEAPAPAADDGEDEPAGDDLDDDNNA